MARRRNRARLPRPELNITSMMDLVLNLEMFFVMVSNFAAAALPLMQPPEPTNSLGQDTESPNKVLINLVPDEFEPTRVKEAVIGVEKIEPGDFTRLTELVQKEVAIDKDVEIHLRADKGLRYDEVEPYLVAIAGSGVQDVHYVVIRDND